jgi:hypothetical protein
MSAVCGGSRATLRCLRTRKVRTGILVAIMLQCVDKVDAAAAAQAQNA